MKFVILFLASNAGLGYAPVASGTVGTLLGIPLFYLLAPLTPQEFVLGWLAVLFVSFWSAHRAGEIYGVTDDGRIVIDELIGYLTAVAFVPFSWNTALAAFLLFRLFDIVKLWPACWFDQKVKNGIGVVMDDVVAGVYAWLSLYALMSLFPQLF
jgi:phosphatidylglycerophosphatase A